jgi:hypothetical protein
VQIVARVVWETDGEELVQTTALGWTGQAGGPRSHRRPALPDQRDLAGRCRRAAAVILEGRGHRVGSLSYVAG